MEHAARADDRSTFGLRVAMGALLVLPLCGACDREGSRSVSAPAREPDPWEVILTPVMSNATLDNEASEPLHPRLDICADGRIFGEGRLLWDPYEPEDALELREWLKGVVRSMPKARRPGSAADSPHVPMGALRIHADRSAPFTLANRLIQECAREEFGIWRIEMAARVPAAVVGAENSKADNMDGYVDLSRPIPEEPRSDRLFCDPVKTRVRVINPGTRQRREVEGPSHRASGGFEYSADRELEYSIGAFRTKDLGDLAQKLEQLYQAGPHWPARSDLRWGITCGEALAVFDLQLDAGFRQLMIAGP